MANQSQQEVKPILGGGIVSFEDSSSAAGSYCVYCDGRYVSSSTKMMGAGYDYKSHLAELKALFGI